MSVKTAAHELEQLKTALKALSQTLIEHPPTAWDRRTAGGLGQVLATLLAEIDGLEPGASPQFIVDRVRHTVDEVAGRPEDEQVANRMTEIIFEASLQGHELGQWEDLGDGRYVVRCVHCSQTVAVSPHEVKSFLAPECPGTAGDR